MRSKYLYEIAGVSDAGTVKESNEDVFYINTIEDICGETIVFALVADGMGGTAYGGEAAKIIKSEFRNWFTKTLPTTLAKANFSEELLNNWESVVRLCNIKINNKSSLEKTGGSTLTILLLYKGIYYAGNIGDSRIYLYTNENLYQITKDHSWAQQALDQGLSASEIEADDRRHMLTRCIGGRTKVAEVDYFTDSYELDDYFLLCSDGLRHLISVEEMKSILNETIQINAKLNHMITVVKERNEKDNITGILIQVKEGASYGA